MSSAKPPGRRENRADRQGRQTPPSSRLSSVAFPAIFGPSEQPNARSSSPPWKGGAGGGSARRSTVTQAIGPPTPQSPPFQGGEAPAISGAPKSRPRQGSAASHCRLRWSCRPRPHAPPRSGGDSWVRPLWDQCPTSHTRQTGSLQLLHQSDLY